ncbi:hypothetical protein AAE02nite_43090 [Adhaeribacter aerolatus]|uniref:STAS/SEC14 domain-containing protein n=1 Tax=Adhaeribacter aerolatus TaxID=670289 RepID=A0A512B3V7_9BACT|nr:hypothetical protein [Adhaeribacter aerolatus]GEO06645.1 hypothetical protein AAE02nite_43090 [Adhaeribacter aerolatus]
MIPVTLIHETAFVKIEANPELRYVQITWLQQPSSTLFQKETRNLVQYALTNNFNKSLFDVRKRDFLDIADQNWLVRDIFPLFKGRIIQLAYLVNSAGLEIMDTFRIHDCVINNPELKRSVQIEIFLDIEDALQWLLKEAPVA